MPPSADPVLRRRSSRFPPLAARVLAVGLLVVASFGCARVQRSAAELEIVDRDVAFLFQGSEHLLGCTASEVISKMRGHAIFEWTVEVEKPGDQQWRLRLKGVSQFERKPTAWDISLKPGSSSASALVVYASESDGDEVHPDQLYTFLAPYCSRPRPR